MAGTDPLVEISAIEGALRGKLVDRFTEVVAELAENNLSFVQLQANKTEFTQAMLPRIHDYFKAFGLDLTDFTIQSITLPDEVNEFLRKNTQMNMVGDLQKFMQFQQAKAMEEAAKNGGNMSAPGMDMASMMMANMMMQNMQNQQQNQQNNQQNQQNNQNQGESKEKIMAMLKELGELKTQGILTEEEFNAKKKELLAKL
jgi:membrane protease subunit (stomatin/prohibitin family)